MAHFLNRVRVYTTTTGTGSITPGAAVASNWLSFSDAGVEEGRVLSYLLENAGNFELGKGTYGSGVLSRDSVDISRIGGVVGTSKLNLTGTTIVSVVMLGQDLKLKLTATTHFYSNSSTGSDTTGNGTSAAPWATLQKAYDMVRQNYDLNGQLAALHLADGNYTSCYFEAGWTGSGFVQILGNPSNVDAVTIDGANSGLSWCFGSLDPIPNVVFNIGALRLRNKAGGQMMSFPAPIYVRFWDQVNGGGQLKFYFRTSGAPMVFLGEGANLIDNGGNVYLDYTDSAATQRSFVDMDGPSFCSLNNIYQISGTPAYSDGFMKLQSGGVLQYNHDMAGGGSATGRQAVLNPGGLLLAYGAAANIPGDANSIFMNGGRLSDSYEFNYEGTSAQFLTERTYSQLPTVQGNQAGLVWITDALVSGIGSKISAGGGTRKVLAGWDGSAWTVWASKNDPVREKLVQDRIYYVRYDLGVCTMTIASPAVVTRANHGLQANDPIVFTLPYDMGDDDTESTACTTFDSGTDICTFNNHGFSANDPIKFFTTGTLPTSLFPDTRYFVRDITTNTFKVSLTSGGGAIDFTGSLTGKCRTRRDSFLPTGVTEGQVYFVLATDLSTDTLKFSNTVGGAAINTSGTQAGKITLQTGNDANNGLAATRTGSLLTPNAAVKVVHALDLNNQWVNVILADSLYLPDTTGDHVGTIIFIEGENPSPGDANESMAVGTGHVMFWGNEVSRSLVRLSDLGGVDYLPIVQAGWAPYTVNFRKLTIMGGNVQGSPLSLNGRGNFTYAEHLSFWGDPTGALLNYTNYGIGYIHGMMEIFGNPGTIISGFGGSETFYLAYGQDYYGGVIAFKPQTGIVVSTGNNQSDVSISSAIKFEGDFTGATPFSIYPGGLLEHSRYNTYWGEQLPGGQAPVIRAGGKYAYRDSDLPAGVGQYFAFGHYTLLLQRPYTVSTLPTAAEGLIIGSRAMVSDASTPTFGNVVTGSGSTLIPVYWDGTNWRVG